jgi:hypothetical protein
MTRSLATCPLDLLDTFCIASIPLLWHSGFDTHTMSARHERQTCGSKGEACRHVFRLLDPKVMGCICFCQQIGKLLQSGYVWNLHDNLTTRSISHM